MNEILRRRTFAIISHPDAGKTTLTEKLLLYGGALHLAGTVTARKNQRATASDWMELEKKRGISISSTVLQFDYDGYRINLLDTPGHRDFSEDTYRVLTAVDAAVMVIDAGKGIEAQTLKLFEVCRRRHIPIFTFMNKMDRPSREPLELIDELEKVLGLKPFPVNWPMGNGTDFRGVYDRLTKQAHMFERTPGGAYKAPVEVADINDRHIKDKMDAVSYRNFIEEVGMLDLAGTEYSVDEVLTGETTPVFFGSAVNNFGIQLMLDGFVEHSAAPGPRDASIGSISPDLKDFSGFIFKIQGNMNPRHRDKVAFVRVCSGKFTRDMSVYHAGKKIRLSNSNKLFGQERETVDEAWPGDIVGLVGHQEFKIGDTLTENPAIVFDEIPRFPPECFTFLYNPVPSMFKPFRMGLEQLMLEGVVQQFTVKDAPSSSPLLAAVGPLQFEVVQFRLEAEYGVKSRLEPAPWQFVRWLDAEGAETLKSGQVHLGDNVRLGSDPAGNAVIFFPTPWALRYFGDTNKKIALYELPVKQ
ncbi:MAG: peptide chain release factor 3 [Elusimicrobia bacterium GWA2_61_42]|nr:MAG: peptide chain release factor 3 [Elusimicrobia bacterium GWA2_61_42]OGR74875.1 MAG: peptide chain release factor 3 [Elusimicrobia bacterium GWC2_61_25]